MIAHELKVTMFLIENEGYNIVSRKLKYKGSNTDQLEERYVHGLEADYNDRPQWQYSKLFERIVI